MRLPFLDREDELHRIRRHLDAHEGVFICVYGRRRLGKSRLIAEAIQGRPAVIYVGDERDGPLQREALAGEIGRLLPGFGAVAYPGWGALLDRFFHEAPPAAVLVLDELPALVAAAPEIPSLLQKLLDRSGRGPSILVCGSSQGMMLGLVLDASAPLYGRAKEVLRVTPLPLRATRQAFPRISDRRRIEVHAVWGGVPRYWELCRDHPRLEDAIADLVLDPLGVLHREPQRLLRDDLREVVRAASILALVGQGCHRISEIGARLAQPATALSRPVARLVELGYLERLVPFGAVAKDTKRSIYQIAEPFLRFWFRFVEPNRSRLSAGQLPAVARDVRRAFRPYLGHAWESLARQSVSGARIHGRAWRPASRFWGPGRDGQPIEIHVVAESANDPNVVLVGEARLRVTAAELPRMRAEILRKAAACPATAGKRCLPAVWALDAPLPRGRGVATLGPTEVVDAC